MTATFTTTTLVNERVLVSGTDQFGAEGKTVLNSAEWTEVNKRKDFDQAKSAFDAAVEEFFAPLTDAADALNNAVAPKPTDSMSYVVLTEGNPGTPATQEVLVKLSRDSVILRLIESGNYDRLVWVDGELEVLAAS
jgi:hypothetical protein